MLKNVYKLRAYIRDFTICCNFARLLCLEIALGAIQKVCHSLRGKGLTKKMINCDIEGRGYELKSDVTPLKRYCFNNRIRITFVSVTRREGVQGE